MSTITKLVQWVTGTKPEVKKAPHIPRAVPVKEPVKEVIRDFAANETVWLYQHPRTKKLIHVSALHDTVGYELSPQQEAKIPGSTCLGAYQFMDARVYWQQKSEKSLTNEIEALGFIVSTEPLMTLEHALCTTAMPQGLWLKVTIAPKNA